MTGLQDKGPRLRAIAMNAIREARLAFGRVDDPFTDDDAIRAESVYQLLHVQEKVETEYEHLPLANETPISKTAKKVADLLGEFEASEH